MTTNTGHAFWRLQIVVPLAVALIREGLDCRGRPRDPALGNVAGGFHLKRSRSQRSNASRLFF